MKHGVRLAIAAGCALVGIGVVGFGLYRAFGPSEALEQTREAERERVEEARQANAERPSWLPADASFIESADEALPDAQRAIETAVRRRVSELSMPDGRRSIPRRDDLMELATRDFINLLVGDGGAMAAVLRERGFKGGAVESHGSAPPGRYQVARGARIAPEFMEAQVIAADGEAAPFELPLGAPSGTFGWGHMQVSEEDTPLPRDPAGAGMPIVEVRMPAVVRSAPDPDVAVTCVMGTWYAFDSDRDQWIPFRRYWYDSGDSLPISLPF